MASLCRLSVLRSMALLNELLPGDDASEEQEAHEESLVATLGFLLAAASRFACSYTGRELMLTDYSGELATGSGDYALWPREYPVSEVDEIRVWDGSAWVVIDPEHYELLDNRIISYPKRGSTAAAFAAWPCDCRGDNIEIDYSAGYDNSDWDSAELDEAFGVPADLEHAVGVLAALMFMDGKGDQGRLGLSSMSKSVEALVVERFERGLPQSVALVLSAYQRRAT